MLREPSAAEVVNYNDVCLRRTYARVVSQRVGVECSSLTSMGVEFF